MAIRDAQMRVINAQAFSATAVSGSSIDVGGANRDLATGEPIELVLNVTVAGDRTTGDETYTAEVIQATDGALTTSVDVLASRPIPVADLAVGSQIRVPVPPGSITKQYLGARMTLAGTTPSITLTGFFSPSSMVSAAKPQSYPKGYTGPT
jgi:Bbp16-like protein